MAGLGGQSIPQGMVLEMSVARIDAPQGPVLMAVMQDITALRRSEAALQESCALLSFLLALSDDLRLLANAVDIQEAATRMLGTELRASRVFYGAFVETEGVEYLVVEREFRISDDLSFVGRHPVERFGLVRNALTAGRAVVVSDFEQATYTPAVREACRTFRVRAGLGVTLIKEGRLVAVIVVHSEVPRDWSPLDRALAQETVERIWLAVSCTRSRAEESERHHVRQLEWQTEQLRRLAMELTLAEHKTRDLLSKTLHDHIQQLIFSAKLRLDDALENHPQTLPLLAARDALHEAIEATRVLSVDLLPPALRDEGLPDALQWLASWVGKKHEAVVLIHADPRADPGDLEIRVLLFESAREMIFNAVKHGQVKKVWVDLSLQADDRVQLLVTDEGRGFDVQAIMSKPSVNAGLGLFSIRQRLALMGGELRIESEPGEGACVALMVPRGLACRGALAGPAAPPLG